MTYTEQQRIELIDTICKEIADGRSLRAVLRDDDMPDRTTFFKWVKDNKEMLNQYACACEDRAEYIFDEMFEIADDASNDYTKRQIAEGVEVEHLNSEHIQRSRLRIDQRKWSLSKMQPKKYGDKLDLSSDDGSMTPQTNIVTTLTPEQLKQALDK